jgi:hypothetical protein
VPNGALCTKCWVTLIQSAAKARALTDEKPELSDTASRKKQKLNDPNITEKPDGIKMTLQAGWVRKAKEVSLLVTTSPMLRASPAAVVE